MKGTNLKIIFENIRPDISNKMNDWKFNQKRYHGRNYYWKDFTVDEPVWIYD